MDNAKFYSEIADGPSQGAAYWVHTDDNVRLRVGIYRADKDRKGTIFYSLDALVTSKDTGGLPRISTKTDLRRL